MRLTKLFALFIMTRAEKEKFSFREAAPIEPPAESAETKEPVAKIETSEGDGDEEVTDPEEVSLAERMGKLESMLTLILEGQHENQAKQAKISGEIPDHIVKTRQS